VWGAWSPPPPLAVRAVGLLHFNSERACIEKETGPFSTRIAFFSQFHH
jgi:hypothetical protein